MKTFRRIAWLTIGTLSVILMVLAIPQPLFAHQMTYGRYHLWSDRPIDEPAARRVLDDAQRRISKSELYTPNQQFRIFLCNDNWRLLLFSQRLSGAMGGVADFWLTRNIYLRQSDLATNRLIPTHGWIISMSDRTLSYYLAHEATHILESRALGPLNYGFTPRWLIEGYADYVGKGGTFDVAENLAALRAGAQEMDPKASGLYRRYHLAVAYQLDHKHLTARQMFAAKTAEPGVLADLRSDPTFGN